MNKKQNVFINIALIICISILKVIMMDIDNIVAALSDIHEDKRVPRNVRASLHETIGELTSNEENITVKLNTAISILDEVSNDTNIQPFTRTQIWNIVSMLESLQNDIEP